MKDLERTLLEMKETYKDIVKSQELLKEILDDAHSSRDRTRYRGLLKDFVV